MKRYIFNPIKLVKDTNVALHEAILSALTIPGLHLWRGHLDIGQDKPVMIIPGLGAEKRSTLLLVSILNYLGFKAHSVDFGINTGMYAKQEQAILDRTMELCDMYGTSISGVGWSMGGCYLCEFTAKHPQFIKKVVTLDSPLLGADAHPFLENVIGQFGNEWLKYLVVRMQEDTVLPPADKPFTAVRFTSSAIVHGTLSGIRKENLLPVRPWEVVDSKTSHIGGGFSLKMVQLIADRILQNPDSWYPYDPKVAWADLFHRTTGKKLYRRIPASLAT